MFKGAIFDMDGLMFDTESLFSEVQTKICKKRNKQFTVDLKHKMMGQKAIDAITIMLNGLDIKENPVSVFEEQNIDYLELLRTKAVPMSGLFELFNFLNEKNIRKAVATSSNKEWVDILFSRFDIYKEFEFIITGDMVSKGKPDPEIYTKAVDSLGIKAEECVVFEDGLNGVLSAKDAGCRVVAVPSYYTKDQDFSVADIIANSLGDKRLFEFIDNG